ncbi:MBL fold metallo-hydrolase [candidate division KSB1 bacterium]
MKQLIFVLICVLMISGNLYAQDSHYNKKLLPAIRNAAGMIPGPFPNSVNVLKICSLTAPSSLVIEGRSSGSVDAVHTMFQIRYPDGWIMVDVSGDKELLGEEKINEEAFRQSVEALIGANLIIVTHEHFDHIWRLFNSPNAEQYAKKSILTSEQVNSLITKPSHPKVGLTEKDADRFQTVSYDKIFPLAPGVVLIKAPGHSPGGQMVYIRLDSGKELILSGDVATMKEGIDKGLQKPENVSKQAGEDRDAIAKQLKWLKEVEGMGVVVVVSHDLEDINGLIEKGVLGNGIKF